MSSQPDIVRKQFGPLRDKTLRNAIAHQSSKEFPRIGGLRICGLCADMTLEVVTKHMLPRATSNTDRCSGWPSASMIRRAIVNGSLIPTLSP